MAKIKINCNNNQHKQWIVKNQASNLFLFKIIPSLSLSMCVLLSVSFICISAYAKVYFKTTIIKHKNNTGCGSTFEPGASWLPYYCASFCVRPLSRFSFTRTLIFLKKRLSESFQAGIGKPGTQHPWPCLVLKLCFAPNRTQKNNVTMWRNRHICTKFQENCLISGSTKTNFFETWQYHIEPGVCVCVALFN